MQRMSIKYLSYLALLGALLLWSGVAYFAWAISGEEAKRSERIANLEQESIQQSASLKLHALARDTKEDREALESITLVGINSILDGIEGVARDARIPIEIGQASAASDSATPLHTTSLTVDASGSFSQVTHAVALLEAFPVPSTIDQVQLERIENADNKKAAWRAVVRMRVFTTGEIAS